VNRKLVAKIVEKIVCDLTDRRGLRQAWEGIDEEIQEEIRQAWANIILDLTSPDRSA